ncbi:class I SAM-dependent methyltransferase [Tateyamaria armeniaca]|uniref:Class I SAM-dependent methyltransferase n=1 Tax=Tateyamaria armeniaca TaxID=2518930 RepID=A0ABW8URG9_9RHOB
MSSVSDYARLAPDVIAAHATLSDAEIFHPVAAFLPKVPSTLLDIGAGIGRTAAWFASQGVQVTALEPVTELRAAGQARFDTLPFRWVDDELPNLNHTTGLKEQFDTVILCGVWHLLPPEQRDTAMQNIRHVTAPRGRVLMSLRHGPAPDGITTYPVDVRSTVKCARSYGLKAEFQTTARSVQQTNRTRGVTWTWLVLNKT